MNMQLRDSFAHLQEGLINPVSHASLTASPASIAVGMFRSVPAAPTDSSSGCVRERSGRAASPGPPHSPKVSALLSGRLQPCKMDVE